MFSEVRYEIFDEFLDNISLKSISVKLNRTLSCTISDGGNNTHIVGVYIHIDPLSSFDENKQ